MKGDKTQAQWLKLLNLWGAFRKVHTTGVPTGGFGYRTNPNKGMADFVGLVRTGRFVAIERKRPDEDISAEQIKYLEEVNNHGGFGVRIETFEELDGAIRAAMRGDSAADWEAADAV